MSLFDKKTACCSNNKIQILTPYNKETKIDSKIIISMDSFWTKKDHLFGQNIQEAHARVHLGSFIGSIWLLDIESTLRWCETVN